MVCTKHLNYEDNFRNHYHRRFLYFLFQFCKVERLANFSKEKRRVSLVEKFILKKTDLSKFFSKKKKIMNKKC